MEKKVTVVIEKGEKLYSAYVPNGIKSVFLNGQGETIDEAISDMKAALEECRESYVETGKVNNNGKIIVANDANFVQTGTFIAGELNFEYKYDVASIFNHFDEINLSSFARKNGLNESLLRKYKNRLAFASEKQCKKIETGLHRLGQSLVAASL